MKISGSRPKIRSSKSRIFYPTHRRYMILAPKLGISIVIRRFLNHWTRARNCGFSTMSRHFPADSVPILNVSQPGGFFVSQSVENWSHWRLGSEDCEPKVPATDLNCYDKYYCDVSVPYFGIYRMQRMTRIYQTSRRRRAEASITLFECIEKEIAFAIP